MTIPDIVAVITQELRPKLHYLLIHNNKLDVNIFNQTIQIISQVIGETLEKKDYEIALACAKHFRDLTKNDIIKPEIWNLEKLK
jgi:hypothetical protein